MEIRVFLMAFDKEQILAVLDRCCEDATFPMLDNGYVYLAATRLSLYRSIADWAMVIELFGFSPRAEFPDLTLYTFASTLHDRNTPGHYVSPDAYRMYLANHPNDDSRAFYPV